MSYLLRLTALFSAAVMVIPSVSLSSRFCRPKNEQTAVYEYQNANRNDPEPLNLSEGTTDHEFDIRSFSVLRTADGEVYSVPVRDYVIGAVCAEMPALFNAEALKAQAVAAHTYAVRQALYERNAHTDDLCGADFSDDSSRFQAFFSEDEIREHYGDNFDEYYSKVSEAVDSVIDEILVYKEEPIIAAFHSMSSGITESSLNAWGTQTDYLVPAESPEDTDAPKFEQEYSFTSDEIRSRLRTQFSEIELDPDCSKWFEITSVSSSGTVLELNAGNIEMTGYDLRQLLNLRSASFTIDYSLEKGFTVITRGYGHGVGMSQYGANAMAESGKDYRDILMHYYTGTEIISVK